MDGTAVLVAMSSLLAAMLLLPFVLFAFATALVLGIGGKGCWLLHV